MHALILSACCSVVLLDLPRQFYALLHVAVLHELENHVTLGLARVEALVSGLIVAFVGDDRVFSLRYFEVGGRAGDTERVGLGAIGDFAAGQRVGVYGNEEVGLVAVGDVGAALQRNEDIFLARVHHFHVGAVVLHEFAESERDIQVDILFLAIFAAGAGVVSAVARVDDERKPLFLAAAGCKERGGEASAEQQQICAEILVHFISKLGQSYKFPT